MKFTPEQEARFFTNIFKAFGEMKPEDQSVGRQFQKNIINNFILECPQHGIEHLKIEDTYKQIQKMKELLGENFSFMELFERQLDQLCKSNPSSVSSEQLTQIQSQYQELKQKFILWEQDNNIDNF